jgi:hypothetical protein
VNPIYNRAKQLKQSLLEFVLDAEGDLAIALETFSAERLTRFTKSHAQNAAQTDLIVDAFLTQGCIDKQTPLDLFLNHHSELSQADQQLLSQWPRSFTGLFLVNEVAEEDGFELKNWLTGRHYSVRSVGLQPPEQIARLKPGEIVLTRIAPMAESEVESEWMLFSSLILLGKLGKPKLAVAIGNFRQHYSEDLYGDAPELLEQAWRSVAQYHQEWLDFFGSEEVILPGYQANQQLQRFQEETTQRRLAAAGIDSTQSLADLAGQAGVSEREVEQVAQGLSVVQKVTDERSPQPKPQPTPQASPAPAMARPQIDLPENLKKADRVALLTHPHWGQQYLSIYPQLQAILESDAELTEKTKKLVRQSLEDPQMNAYLWHCLAQRYAAPLERLLRSVLEQPNFSLKTGLDALLQSFGKPLTPVLPETASVPLHLHSLFQDAVLEVHKTQSNKPKEANTASKGFQRKSP